ncbi:MAG: hypothetical protein H6834_08935 [Planctomycetes bacterium]|nr:hypothetical protein [Planctomycetota bacterium]
MISFQALAIGRWIAALHVALFTVPLAAQHSPLPAPTQYPSLDSLLETVPPTVRNERGILVAATPRWKAIFEPGVVRFHAALGEDVPGPLESRFTLVDIRRGDTTFFRHDARRGAAPAIDDRTVRYRHTHDLEETLEARDEGLKQSFVFHRPPPGTGDLVVRLRLETPLSAPQGEFPTSLTFRYGARDVMQIGAVLGIDASGHSSNGTMRFDGEFLEFVLSGSFVESASYPLVLDPLIGPRTWVAGTAASDPDIAYDQSTDLYLIVWSQDAQQSGYLDTYGAFLTRSGTVSGNAFFINLFGAGYGPRARVANVNARDGFYVVLQNNPPGNPSREIVGRTVAAGNTTPGPWLIIAQATPTGSWGNPTVCGDRTTSNDSCLVAYEDLNRGEIVTAQVQLHPDGSSTLVSAAVAGVGTGPTICKSGGDARIAFVAWQATPVYVATRAVSMDNVFLSAEGWIAGNATATLPVHSPTVDGDGESFLLVYTREDPVTGHDLWSIDVRVPASSSSIWETSRQGPIRSTSPRDGNAALAFLGRRFGVPTFGLTWLSDDGQGADVLVGTIDETGICEIDEVYAADPMGAWATSTAIASTYSGGADGAPVARIAFAETSTLIPHFVFRRVYTQGFGACAPSNDECSGALSVRDGIFDNVGATMSAGLPFPCEASAGADVWFRIDAGNCAFVDVETCFAETDFPTIVEVFDGSCGSLRSLACNSSSSCSGLGFVAAATYGTFYVRVGGVGGATGTFRLRMDIYSYPRNGRVWDQGGGCPSGGVAKVACPFSPGTTTQFDLESAPPNMPAFCFVCAPNPLSYSCTGGSELSFPLAVLPTMTSASGEASVSFPSIVQPDVRFLVQWLSITTNPDPCGCGGPWAPSNRLDCVTR